MDVEVFWIDNNLNNYSKISNNNLYLIQLQSTINVTSPCEYLEKLHAEL